MAFDINTARPVGFDPQSARPSAPPAPPPTTTGQARPVQAAVGGFVSGTQGLTFGFSDEILGAISAGIQAGVDIATKGETDVLRNYQQFRDQYRGAMNVAQQEAPGTAVVTELAGSAPTLSIQGPARAIQGAGILSNVGRGAVNAGALGAVAGAGRSEAESVGGIAADAVEGGIVSGAIGAGTTGAISAGGQAVRSMTSRLPAGATRGALPARDYAREKVGQSLLRDARGNVAADDAGAALSQAQNRLRQLGPEGRIVDVGDVNTRALLDVTAVVPGRTGPAVQRAIRQRQAGRAGRIAGAAEEALGTQNKGYVNSIQAFDAARREAARPLYEQVEGLAFTVDDDLGRLLQQSSKYHGEAEDLARLQGDIVRLRDLQPGEPVPLKALDTLKQTLWDSAEAARREGKNTLANNLDGLRRQLINKLDDASPKTEDGQSIYKLARDAWGGPSSSITAAEAGRQAMKGDAFDLADQIQLMSASELEAFRIGATQAIRDMAGTEGGQTRLLKMWKEPATSDKLRLIFGGDFNKFRRAIIAEGKLKAAEGIGRGSQTAPRQFAADDLDVPAVQDAAVAAGSAARGDLLGLVTSGGRWMNRIGTPEPVRDEIGRILLQGGPEARNELADLLLYTDRVNRQRAAVARGAGAYIGANAPPYQPANQ